LQQCSRLHTLDWTLAEPRVISNQEAAALRDHLARITALTLSYKEDTALSILPLLTNLRVLDLQSTPEWATPHLPPGVVFPFLTELTLRRFDLKLKELPALLRGFPRLRTVFLDLSPVCKSAADFAAFLRLLVLHGVQEVVVLDGDLKEVRQNVNFARNRNANAAWIELYRYEDE
jgi:hypothetical protein